MVRAVGDALSELGARERELSATGYKGVTKRGRRYEAAMYLRSRRVSLGYHDTPELAAAAYDRAVREHKLGKLT